MALGEGVMETYLNLYCDWPELSLWRLKRRHSVVHGDPMPLLLQSIKPHLFDFTRVRVNFLTGSCRKVV